MIKRKSKTGRPWIKRGPLKTFLFFLGFSTIIWLFVQFSKQYSEAVELPINYINIPLDKALDKNNPSSLEMRVRDYGFNLARYKLVPPRIDVDVSEAREEGKFLIYDLEQHRGAILSQLGLDYDEAIFLQRNLQIGFDQRSVKTVRVVSNIDLGFAVGYSALEEIQLHPDTVRVSGPAGILDTLEEVGTVPLRINNISKNISGTVALDQEGLEDLTFFDEEVGFSLRTDKFTEGRVEIPIEMVNVPEDANVVIFPKEVVVFYQVSLNDFDKIKPSSFKVIVDFKNALASDGSLLAQVVQKPAIVNNVRLNENKIQFVIKR